MRFRTPGSIDAPDTIDGAGGNHSLPSSRLPTSCSALEFSKHLKNSIATQVEPCNIAQPDNCMDAKQACDKKPERSANEV
jgi:hypothetical protein